MKGIVSALFAVMVMVGFAVQADEGVQTTDENESYVVEPVFEANNWNCPRHTKVIAKYCWDMAYSVFTRCGYVCHPLKRPDLGGGGGEVPTQPPMPKNN